MRGVFLEILKAGILGYLKFLIEAAAVLILFVVSLKFLHLHYVYNLKAIAEIFIITSPALMIFFDESLSSVGSYANDRKTRNFYFRYVATNAIVAYVFFAIFIIAFKQGQYVSFFLLPMLSTLSAIFIKILLDKFILLRGILKIFCVVGFLCLAKHYGNADLAYKANPLTIQDQMAILLCCLLFAFANYCLLRMIYKSSVKG
jgi:hypothetical protein